MPITSRGDVILIVGTYVLPEVFPELGDIFDPRAKVIHVDLNAYEIAKSHRVDHGVIADPKLTLAALAAAIEGSMTKQQRSAAEGRGRDLAQARTPKVGRSWRTTRR